MSYYARAYYNGDGSNTNFAVPFPFAARSHVFLLLNGTSVPFTWTSDSLIVAVTAPPAGTGNVEVSRITVEASVMAQIQAGTIYAGDLNLDWLQMLYLIQELTDDITYANFLGVPALVAQAQAAAAAAIAAAGTVGAAHYSGEVVTGNHAVTSAFETTFINASVACTQTLPAAPNDFERHTFVDAFGGAGTNRLTIAGNGKNINGQANWYIESNYSSLTIQYSATMGAWFVLS